MLDDQMTPDYITIREKNKRIAELETLSASLRYALGISKPPCDVEWSRAVQAWACDECHQSARQPWEVKHSSGCGRGIWEAARKL